MAPVDLHRECRAAIRRSHILQTRSSKLVAQSQVALHASMLILADVAHIKGCSVGRAASP